MHEEWLKSTPAAGASGAESAVVEEVWTQLLRESDLHAAISSQRTHTHDEADGRTCRLAWASDEWWALTDEQLRLLSFEALLLSQAAPLEKEETAPDDIAGGGEATPRRAAVDLRRLRQEDARRLSEELSRRLAASIVLSGLEEEEARLPTILRARRRPDEEQMATALEHFHHEERPASTAPPALTSAADAGGTWQEEELLEPMLARLIPLAADAINQWRGEAQRWCALRADEVATAFGSLEHRLGLREEPPLPKEVRRQRSQARRLRAKITDSIVEEVRLHLAIPRDLAARLARLVRLPPPPPSWHLHDHTSRLPPSSLYEDVQLYVPYRLLLLQQLHPSHFKSHQEYADFAERQLAAFVAGLLCAVREADASAKWDVRGTASAPAEPVDSTRLEALVLLVAREQLLPLLRQPEETYEEAPMLEALRKLTNLSWRIFAALPKHLPRVEDGEQRLPFFYPSSLALYEPIVGVSVSPSGGRAPLPLVAAAQFEARLLRLRRCSLLLSEHTHLLCMLQRSFASWVDAMAPGASADLETMLRLTRVLHATSRQLLRFLRMHSQEGVEWGAAEKADHREVLPSVLRFMQQLMADYHSAFNALDGPAVEIPLVVLREAFDSYFDLLSVAHSFTKFSGLSVDQCLLSAEDAARKEQEESEAAATAVGTAASLEAKVKQLEDRVADGGLAKRLADEFFQRSSEWALSQPEIIAFLEQNKMLHEPAPSEDAKPSDDSSAKWRTRQSELITRAGHRANAEEFDPPRALRFFEAAHALAPRTPLLLSCANMLLKVGRCGLAAELYRRVLVGADHEKKEHVQMAQRKLREADDQITSTREALSQLRAQLGSTQKAAAKARGRDGAKAQRSNAHAAFPSDAELAKLHVNHARHLILSSAEKRSRRLVSSFLPPLAPTAVTELLRVLLADLQLEAEYFSPAFTRYLEREEAYRVALRHRADLFQRAAAPSLSTLANWSNNAAHASEKLEVMEEWASAWPMLEELNQLLNANGLSPLELRAGGKDKPPVTEVVELMSPLINEWTSNLTTRFDKQLDAAWKRETWVSINATSSATPHAAVVWDIFKLFMSTLEVFFGEFDRMHDDTGLPPPIQSEWVNDLLFRMFIILNKFLNKMRQDLGSWEALRPRRENYPELDTSKGNTFWQGSRFILDKLIPPGEIAGAQAAERTVHALCVRINSLQFCIEELSKLSLFIQTHWTRLQESMLQRGRKPLADLTTVIHEEAPRAVQATIEEMCTFIGAKIVFEDLREPLIDKLYLRTKDEVNTPVGELWPMLHSRRGNRMLLQHLLDKVLISILEEVREKSIRDAIIFSIFTAIVEALEHILLDSGAKRAFQPEDTDRLLADVELLRQYFIAKDLTGQVRGLAETLVHAHTMRLHAVVELMKRSSDSLVVMFLATAGGPVSPVPDWDAKDPQNKYSIARILLQRARLETE
ncbi:hypothetical protein AB1Y20_011156 [Prymnesium parvum]|uniref:MHD2 domain-containing protein n=1 Tax=Prymnesium parvum TaxID=97485 RepID=A0AB34IPP3_PRYPA